MLYLLQYLYINEWGMLRIFKSITMRASIAFVLAFLFMIVFGKPFIAWLKKKIYGATDKKEKKERYHKRRRAAIPLE